MKGIVFNLLEEVMRRERGEEAWETLLDSAGLDSAYTSLGSYADEEMFQLVGAASAATNQSRDEVFRWFGRKAIPLLAEKYPGFFGTSGVRPFLLTLNEIIHPEVRKLYPGAGVPVFDFDASDPACLLMGYHSERKLCTLAQGFVEGAADYYREQLSFEHLQCMHRGDEKCLFRIRNSPPSHE